MLAPVAKVIAVDRAGGELPGLTVRAATATVRQLALPVGENPQVPQVNP